MMSKKKLLASGAALTMAAVLALTGTFAWQSISQKAKNEAQAALNPGARLHDDFNGSIKRVYVENFTDPDNGGVDVFARVRLYEYMELGEGAGKKDADGSKAADNKAVSVVDTADFNDETTWTLHGSAAAAADDAKIEAYWNWTTGGATMYMPTFNKDKDSLAADINGTYGYQEGGVSKPYGDFKNWETETVKKLTGTEYYDDDLDDTPNDHTQASGAVAGSNYKTVAGVEHTAADTLGAEVITMAQWKADKNSAAGNFWVLDTDGWYYWANPIKPGTATGMLLSGISLKNPMSDSWYYAINVEAQFATGDDLGWQDSTDAAQRTGFYDPNKGNAPSADAETLLATIGAIPAPKADKVTITAPATTVAKGGNLTFTANVTLNGADAADKTVTWSVSGGVAGTTIGTDGKLTVATGETATALVVTATHHDYALGDISESVVVKVTAN